MEFDQYQDPIQTLTSGDGQPTPNPSDAAKLIGIKAVPAGLSRIKELAAEARAYHVLDPYPLYHFRDWKTEDRGPLPRCLPIAKSAVNRGARWLFGKAPALTCPANSKFEEFVKRAWRKERMPSRLVAMARQAAIDGGIVLKFAYDSARQPQPLSIMALSLVDEARLYYDPHDCERLLMARIQYRYFDAAAGKTYWYREEWTEEEEVHYEPLADERLGSTKFKKDPDTFDGWQISSREPNPLGVIPVVHVKNIETDDTWGVGDCWDLWRIFDRINLSWHLMDRSNQFDGSPSNIFVDLEVDEQDIDTPLAPGQDMEVHTREDSTGAHQGKVIPIEHAGKLRPAMMDYAKGLKKELLAAASSVEVDQSEFTNKGNLTMGVLQQLYLPQIEATEEKRRVWGGDEECDGALVAFWSHVATALRNLGVNDLGLTDDEESYTINVGWHPYFEASENEKTAAIGRIQEEEIAGYLTHERAIEEAARVEGRTDVAQLKEDLAKEPRPSLTETDPLAGDQGVDNALQNVSKLQRAAGKDGL